MFKIGDLVHYMIGISRQVGRIIALEESNSNGNVWKVEIAPGLSQFYSDNELSLV